MPDRLSAVKFTLVFVSVNIVKFLVSNEIVEYIFCLEVLPAVVVSYCRRASCAYIAKAAQ